MDKCKCEDKNTDYHLLNCPKTGKATPDVQLEYFVMSPHEPKNEALWWAKRRIEQLLQAVCESRELKANDKICPIMSNDNEKMHCFEQKCMAGDYGHKGFYCKLMSRF